METNRDASEASVSGAVGASRLAGTALALGLWATAMWFAWLRWDRVHIRIEGVRYDVAPNTYSAWQIIGCGLAIAAGAVLAYLWLRRAAPAASGLNAGATVLLALAGAVGFVVPWTRDASSNPTEDGLFLFASLYLLVGGGIGLWGLLAVTEMIADSRHSSRT